MSIDAINSVFKRSRTRGTDRLVMLVLADRANDDGQCWPGVQDISERAVIEPRSVRRCIGRLVKLGEITVVRAKGGFGCTNLYRLTLPDAVAVREEKCPGCDSTVEIERPRPGARERYAEHRDLAGERCSKSSRVVRKSRKPGLTGQGSGTQTRTDQSGFSRPKPGPLGPRKPGPSCAQPGPSCAQPGPVGPPNHLKTITEPKRESRSAAASAAAAAVGHGGAECEEIHAALESAGIGEPTLSQIATDPRLTIEAVRAATKLADSRRTNNRAGFIISILRDKPPELAKAIDTELAELKRVANARASAGRLQHARETVAAASEAAIESAIESACDRIRSIHPTARPRVDFERWRSCSATSEELGRVLPPDLATALSVALREPAEAIA